MVARKLTIPMFKTSQDGGCVKQHRDIYLSPCEMSSAGNYDILTTCSASWAAVANELTTHMHHHSGLSATC